MHWLACHPFSQCTLPTTGPWYRLYETPPFHLALASWSVCGVTIAFLLASAWVLSRNFIWRQIQRLVGRHVVVFGTTPAARQVAHVLNRRHWWRPWPNVLMVLGDGGDDYWSQVAREKNVLTAPSVAKQQFQVDQQAQGIATFDAPRSSASMIPAVSLRAAGQIVVATADSSEALSLLETFDAGSNATGKTQILPKTTVIIDNSRLLETLSDRHHDGKLLAPANLTMISSATLAVRDLHREKPFDRLTYADEPGTLHLLFVGYNDSAAEVARYALQMAHYKDGRTLHLTVLDTGAAAAAEILKERTHQFEVPPSIEGLECDFNNRALAERLLESVLGGKVPVNAVYICQDQPNDRLHRLTLVENVVHELGVVCPPIYTKPFKASIQNNIDTQAERFAPAQGLHDEFGRPEKIFASDLDYQKRLDAIARKTHEDYLSNYPPQGTPRPTQLPWDRLAEFWRQSNRLVADHLWVKLRDLRMHAVHGVIPQCRLLTEEVDDAMAAAEHRRWSAVHYLAGWEHASTRDYDAKKHHSLVPFQQVPEQERFKDREAVSSVVSQLSENGYGVLPDLRVALVVDEGADKSVIKPVLAVLRDIVKSHKNRYVMLASTYEGAIELGTWQRLQSDELHPLIVLQRPHYDVLRDLGDDEMRVVYLDALSSSDTIIATRNASSETHTWWMLPGLLEEGDIIVHLGERALGSVPGHVSVVEMSVRGQKRV